MNPFNLIMIPIGLYAATLTTVAQALVPPSPQPFQPPAPNSQYQPEPWWYRL
jgi:hypothetical protein